MKKDENLKTQLTVMQNERGICVAPNFPNAFLYYDINCVTFNIF